MIGDPKQSIYGFRGADLATYAAARDEIAPDAAPVRLRRNFRSSPAMIDAANGVLDPEASTPFFSGDLVYEPALCGRPELASDEEGVPVRLLRVVAEDESKLPMRLVRGAFVAAMADEIAAQRDAPGAPPARETFVAHPDPTRVRGDRRRAGGPRCPARPLQPGRPLRNRGGAASARSAERRRRPARSGQAAARLALALLRAAAGRSPRRR